MLRNPLFIVIALLQLTGCVNRIPTPPPYYPGNLDIQITGLRSDEGQVVVMLFDPPPAPPFSVDDAERSALVPIRVGVGKASFRALKQKTYTVIAFHDEDSDNALGPGVEGVAVVGGNVHRTTPSIVSNGDTGEPIVIPVIYPGGLFD